MGAQAIKSGPEVVADFVAALQSLQGLDAGTVDAVRELHQSGKPTQTRLLQLLAEKRKGLANDG